MQKDMSELARKYQEEMLRLYGKRRPEPVPEQESEPAPAAPEPQPDPEPMEEPSQAQFDEEIPEEIYGDEDLPTYIRPVPELPEEWTAQAEYEKANTAEGYLRVITAAAEQFSLRQFQLSM